MTDVSAESAEKHSCRDGWQNAGICTGKWDVKGIYKIYMGEVAYPWDEAFLCMFCVCFRISGETER